MRIAPAEGLSLRVRFLEPSVFLGTDVPAVPRAVGTAKKLRAQPSALLLAGCQDREYCYDASFGGRPNGAFSFVALQALAKLEPGATYDAWFQAIKKGLPSREYPQTPNLVASSSMRRWRVWG